MKKRLAAFAHAWNGIRHAVATETNMQIHLVAAVLAALFGWLLDLGPLEWVAIVFAIGLVWGMEVVNSAIERLVDLASPTFHPLAKQAKDLAAGAVLIASLTALVIGAIVFVPRILH